uniref:Peroxidase n=1 Tax=Musa acuminata subsp. malaccensis TaxID=214687 RepID=A0A804KSU1_MUSAM|nr:PREDICTED: cationic peroxidase 1-like [Musa acuminata subsp. malaccensis]
MASFRGLSCSIALCSLIISFFFVPLASAQLSPTFYNTSCPNALSIIRTAVRAAVARDRRMGASLLRLHFHDCFVQGCDASLLLDDTSTFTGEKTANPNNNSLRGFEVIDAIKSKLESACKQVVSCADIVAVAARDSVVALGGPTWTVELGRRDSTTASLSSANTDIPGPTADLRTLISSFSGKGLSASDMAALSGAHTIGQARCFLFRARIYNDTNIDPSFASSLQSNCSSSGGDNELSPLDSTTPTVFDNDYYANLVRERGLLHSDQQLFMNGGGSVESQVGSYATNSAKFFSDFASAMVKMASISPLTGSSGEIRINCRKIN